jgi:hypothetical protein
VWYGGFRSPWASVQSWIWRPFPVVLCRFHCLRDLLSIVFCTFSNTQAVQAIGESDIQQSVQARGVTQCGSYIQKHSPVDGLDSLYRRRKWLRQGRGAVPAASKAGPYCCRKRYPSSSWRSFTPTVFHPQVSYMTCVTKRYTSGPLLWPPTKTNHCLYHLICCTLT